MKPFITSIVCLLMLGCSAGIKREEITQEISLTQKATLDSLHAHSTQLLDSLHRLELKIDSAMRYSQENLERFREYRKNVATYSIPDNLYFCEDRVPLEIREVRERIAKELYLLMDDQGQLTIYVIRSMQMFPVIEQLLTDSLMPLDLKYVAVVESGLKTGAVSSAKAMGLWQFTGPTGKEYGLKKNSFKDTWRSLEASTIAAIKFFKDLHAKYGDWALTLAGYNAGPGNVDKALSWQGVDSYWKLILSRETEQYVPRIIAVKIILENPDIYGILPEMITSWEREESDTVTVTVKKSLPARMVADWTESYYRHIRQLNPELTDKAWGSGEHLIHVPFGTRQQFLDSLAVFRGVNPKQKKK